MIWGRGGASPSPYSDVARDAEPTELKSDAARIGSSDGAREFLDEGTNEGSIDSKSLSGVGMA